MSGDMPPSLGAERAEGSAAPPRLSFSIIDTGEADMAGIVLHHSQKRRPRYKRTHIVQRKAANGGGACWREHHAHKPAHRRADPIDTASGRAGGAENAPEPRGRTRRHHPSKEGCGVGEIEPEGVIALMRQPF